MKDEIGKDNIRQLVVLNIFGLTTRRRDFGDEIGKDNIRHLECTYFFKEIDLLR